MATNAHLDKAPITEAIIDFRVKLSADVTDEQLKEIASNLGPEFPDVEEKKTLVARIEMRADAQPKFLQQDGDSAGYWCKSADGHNITQIRMNGFTFSELKPYTDWKKFSSKAKGLWEKYQEGTQCDVISRIAVRYINHLELPMKQGSSFEDFLSAAPKVPDSLPQSISRFLSQVTIVEPDEKIFANVTQTLAPVQKPDCVTVLLDIDVFTEVHEIVEVEEIWATFERLRDFKNLVFFNFITEKTKELFE